MRKGFAGLLKFLVCQRKIVVGIGVGGRQLQSSVIGLNRFVDSSRLIEHIAEVEVSQRVTRVGFDGRTIMLFRETIFLAIVVERSDVDVSRGVSRIVLQNSQISCDRVCVRVRIFFERNAAGEQLSDVRLVRIRPQRHDRRSRNYFLIR
jgi:hypothetical protein